MTVWPARDEHVRGWQTWGRYAFPAWAPNVRRWFMQSLLAPGGGRERLARRLVGRAPFGLAAIVADCRADIERAPSDPPPALARLEAILGAPEAMALLKERGERWQMLVESSDPEVTRPRTLAFLFRQGEARPELVVRMSFSQDRRERESMWGRLERLGGTLPAELAGTLPRLLAFVSADDATGEFCEVLRGRSGYSRLLSSARPKTESKMQLAFGLDWFGRFHQATRTPGADRHSVPHGAGHGDSWVRNVLFEGGRVSGVLDWEQSIADAPVSRDVTTFLLSVSETYQRRVGMRNAVTGFRKSFVEPGWFRSCAERGIDDYRKRLGHGLPDLDVMLRSELERRLGASSVLEVEDNLERCLCLLN